MHQFYPELNSMKIYKPEEWFPLLYCLYSDYLMLNPVEHIYTHMLNFVF